MKSSNKHPKFTDQESATIAAAEVLGQQAFVNGKPAAPAMDQAAMDLIKPYSTPDFSKSYVIQAILQSWSNGFHTANLAGDIQ